MFTNLFLLMMYNLTFSNFFSSLLKSKINHLFFPNDSTFFTNKSKKTPWFIWFKEIVVIIKLDMRKHTNVSIFSTVVRQPKLFNSCSFVDYDSATSFARVAHGFEHKFVSECKRLGIQIMTYPPHFNY